MIVAHRLSTVRHADEIIVMSNGVVAERGTHQELLDMQGTYSDLWTIQTESALGGIGSPEEVSD